MSVPKASGRRRVQTGALKNGGRPFIQQILAEDLLCAKVCHRHWATTVNKIKSPPSWTYLLMGRKTITNKKKK